MEESKIFIEPIEEKSYFLKELVSGINKSNLHSEVDFGKSEGNEQW
ncbi:MAG: hypothetical protein L3J41_02400 [Melioribacteraceae bacterium]|nr:hypothetical protein [Melioribacteraceae bacterium]